MPRNSRHRAFTLIELLIVIAIIVTLSSLTLVAAKALGIGSKKTMTGTILAAVRKGIELSIASRGAIISPTEHPLAGSRPGRLAFIGYRGRVLNPDGTTTVGSKIAVDTTSEALLGAEEWYLNNAADQARCLMPDDVFNDPGVPIMYGMRRDYLRVFGAELSATTRYRRLPRPKPPATQTPGPYTSAAYPDGDYFIRPTGFALDNKRSIDYLFGASTVLAELAGLKALYEPPDDVTANRMFKPASIASSASEPAPLPDNDGRIWSDQASKAGLDHWAAGMVKDPNPTYVAAPWKTYKLRGMAIYDAWGREVFFSYAGNGGVRLLSAGNDGVLRWDPGINMNLATAADATGPAGDDKDGSRDNVVQEVGK